MVKRIDADGRPMRSATAAPRSGETIGRRRFLAASGALGVLGIAGSGCAAYENGGEPPSDGGSDAEGTGSGASDGAITLGLTYVPDVQFAPFYVAERSGYFADAGVEVGLRHHGQDEDLFGALSNGSEQVVVAGGDEMMQARDGDIDVVAFQTLYREYPVCLVVPEDSDITEAADLAGRTVGVPGEFGETWFGLLALLQDAGLTRDDVEVEIIGFTQQAALAGGQVDAVMGFVNNDVPQFSSTGLEVRAVELGDVPLVGVSLGASGDMIAGRAEDLRGITEAVARAVADIAADPQLAVDAAKEAMPGVVDDEQQQIMHATIEATVPLFGDVPAPGGDDVDGWGAPDPELAEEMSAFLHEAGLTESAVPSDEAVSTEIVAG